MDGTHDRTLHWSPRTATSSLHTPKIENIQMSEEFPSKIIFDEFCEIVANIQKMKFYSSYFLQYYLQNVGVEAICMEGSQSRFRIKRGSWCCHWMQYAARDLIRPRYLFSLNDNPRCVKRFCIMSLISSSSIE